MNKILVHLCIRQFSWFNFSLAFGPSLLSLSNCPQTREPNTTYYLSIIIHLGLPTQTHIITYMCIYYPFLHQRSTQNKPLFKHVSERRSPSVWKRIENVRRLRLFILFFFSIEARIQVHNTRLAYELDRRGGGGCDGERENDDEVSVQMAEIDGARAGDQR